MGGHRFGPLLLCSGLSGGEFSGVPELSSAFSGFAVSNAAFFFWTGYRWSYVNHPIVFRIDTNLPYRSMLSDLCNQLI